MAELSPAHPSARPTERPRLPLRDGVGPSCLHLPAGHWPSLLDCLTERFPAIARATWAQRLVAGDVLDAEGSPLRADSSCLAGTRIYYYRAVDAEPVVPGEVGIIHRDEHLLVVDKPHFLPVSPIGRYVQETLLTRLRRLGGLDDLVPLHRIDRETAGLVLCSLNPATRDAYTALFREQRITKVYEAVARARPELAYPLRRHSRIDAGEPFFRRREVAGEANADTTITLLRQDGDLALYEARPLTGRTHQIRVHFQALDMPLLNDRLYPELLTLPEDDFSAPLQLLARSLQFNDPLSGEPRRFDSRRDLLITRATP